MARTERIRAELRGRQAERIAALWLILKGYSILAGNYRCHCGEIDLIAAKRGVLAFVEVKYRRDLAAARAAVSDTNWQRISQSASYWAPTHPIADTLDWRYDLIAICPWRRPYHFTDFWRP